MQLAQRQDEAAGRATRAATSKAAQQRTSGLVRSKAEAAAVLSQPDGRSAYLPHLSRKALGFEPPGAALRRPSEQLAATFRLSLTSPPPAAATAARGGDDAAAGSDSDGGGDDDRSVLSLQSSNS